MNIEPAYQEALDFIYSFVDYSMKKNFIYSPENFNLDRMRAFASALGMPYDRYKIIHVAGTKGKGSVSAMCASALQAAGYRTGFYSSPHMLDFNERIQVDGKPISHGDLVDLLEEVKPAIATIPQLTTFEITTALAMLYFALCHVDIAVLEVGLGGRLDSTNIVTPLVTVITSISYDHTQVLGNTLAEIAGEKAGIIKPDVPLVIAPQKEEALQVVTRIADKRRSPRLQVGVDYLFTPLSHSLENQSFLVWPRTSQRMEDGTPEPGGVTHLTIPLLGRHQVENAATAYATLQMGRVCGLHVDEASIAKGFAQVCWPGRFEILQRDPPVVIDSAHNRDSALKLRLTLDDYFPDYPVVLVFGTLEDKDIPGMFAELMPRVKQVIVTKGVHPRAVDPERVIELAHQFEQPIKVVVPVAEAMKEALRLAGNESVILATGGIFLSAEAWQGWLRLRELPTSIPKSHYN